MKFLHKHFSYFTKLVLLFSLFFFGGCLRKFSNKPIVVATCADIEPYSFKDKDNYVGFEIEIMQNIGKILKRPIVFHETYHLDVINKLKTQEVDCAIGCLSDRGNDDEKFSISYLDSMPHILMHNLSGSIQDFGKIISVLTYSKYDDIAKIIFPPHDSLIKPLHSHSALVEDYLEKNCNFYITDKFHAKEIQKKNKLHCIGNFAMEGYKIKIAIMFHKNSELKKQIDNALIQMEKKQILNSLRQKWNLPSESDLTNEVKESPNKT